MSRLDFSAAHEVLRGHVQAQRLAGVSSLVLSGGQVVDSFCTGRADVEQDRSLQPDAIHRAFSNTKLITSVMTLMLVDEGRIGLDQPLKHWLPGFATTQVLRPGAQALDDTVPLARDITVRHLLSHQAGLSHGVFDPGTLIYGAYHASGVRHFDCDTRRIAQTLPSLPLLFQPGEGWEYAMGHDLLARVVEIVTGLPYAQALQQRLLGPLGMVDTGYVLRPEQLPRLAALYGGQAEDPDEPGLRRLDAKLPWPEAFLKPVARQAGASGLFTTQADMLALLCRLLPGGGGLLRDDTLKAMARDHLPPTQCVQFPHTGPLPALGYGLAGAVLRQPSTLEPCTPLGELQWGGLAGTHWALSPATGHVLVLMTQRYMGFWNPYWFQWKAAVYQALGVAAPHPARLQRAG